MIIESQSRERKREIAKGKKERESQRELEREKEEERVREKAIINDNTYYYYLGLEIQDTCSNRLIGQDQIFKIISSVQKGDKGHLIGKESFLKYPYVSICIYVSLSLPVFSFFNIFELHIMMIRTIK